MISLESAIRTCKVETGLANKIQSERWLNSNDMVCPMWNGVDTAGRSVNPDTFMTKTAGCATAEDRIVVENSLRPQFAEYINLGAQGIKGDIYGNTTGYIESGNRSRTIADARNYTGNFGMQLGTNIIPSCGKNTYKNAMAEVSQQAREAQYANNGFNSNEMRKCGGN